MKMGDEIEVWELLDEEIAAVKERIGVAEDNLYRADLVCIPLRQEIDRAKVVLRVLEEAREEFAEKAQDESNSTDTLDQQGSYSSDTVDQSQPGSANNRDEGERTCTCHPDDRPPGPCMQKFAASECQRAWNKANALPKCHPSQAWQVPAQFPFPPPPEIEGYVIERKIEAGVGMFRYLPDAPAPSHKAEQPPEGAARAVVDRMCDAIAADLLSGGPDVVAHRIYADGDELKVDEITSGEFFKPAAPIDGTSLPTINRGDLHGAETFRSDDQRTLFAVVGGITHIVVDEPADVNA
jgi:hypothetical protein